MPRRPSPGIVGTACAWSLAGEGLRALSGKNTTFYTARGASAEALDPRCGMGLCQGRVCGPAAEFLFGWRLDSVRPPIFPVELGHLAQSLSIPPGGSRLQPVQSIRNLGGFTALRHACQITDNSCQDSSQDLLPLFLLGYRWTKTFSLAGPLDYRIDLRNRKTNGRPSGRAGVGRAPAREAGVEPWPRSGGCVHASHQTPGQSLPAYARGRSRSRTACG